MFYVGLQLNYTGLTEVPKPLHEAPTPPWRDAAHSSSQSNSDSFQPNIKLNTDETLYSLKAALHSAERYNHSIL